MVINCDTTSDPNATAAIVRAGSQAKFSSELQENIMRGTAQKNIVALDVIERKKNKKALCQSEEKFRTFADFTYDWEYWLSLDGHFEYISPACERITGYSPDEFLANPELLTAIIHPGDRQQVLGHLTNEIKMKKTYHLDFRIITKDKRVCWISHNCQPVINTKGIHLGCRASNRDISKRKAMQQKTLRYARRLEQSNKDLQNFAAMASHDLQEPLILIQAFAGRILSKCTDDLNDQAVAYIKQIEKTSTRMQMLVNSMLNYAQIASQPRQFRTVFLNGIAEEVVANLQVKITEKNGTIEINNLPVITGDPDQMYQLLQNLISNAIKYHKPDEAPHVKISSRQIQPDNPSTLFWEILFEDNGLGFNENEVKRIFGFRTRLHATTQNYKGTGIGLAVCRKIVDHHGGTITAKSTHGRGATFIVRLPQSSPAHQAMAVSKQN